MAGKPRSKEAGEGLDDHGHERIGHSGGQAEQGGSGPAGPSAGRPPGRRSPRRPPMPMHRIHPMASAAATGWSGRRGRGQKQGQAGQDHHQGDPLRPGDRVVRPGCGQGEGEQQRGREQGLHDDERAPAKGGGLKDEASDVSQDAEEPHRLADEMQEQAGPARVLGRHGDGGALLEGHAGTEEQGRQKGQHDRQNRRPCRPRTPHDTCGRCQMR